MFQCLASAAAPSARRPGVAEGTWSCAGIDLADGVGFEPTRPLRTCRFSRPVPSTARPPIHAAVRWEDSRLERPLAEISQNRHPPPVCAAAITQEITGKIWPAALGRGHVMAMAK